MLKSFRRLTQVRVYWEWIDSPPVGVHLPFFGQTMALALLARKKTTQEYRKVEYYHYCSGTCRKRPKVEVQPAQCARPRWHLGEAGT